jgi:hypothetical protein
MPRRYTKKHPIRTLIARCKTPWTISPLAPDDVARAPERRLEIEGELLRNAQYKQDLDASLP